MIDGGAEGEATADANLPDLVRIGSALYRPRTGEITRAGEVRRLRPQAALAFELLVQRAGHLVERDELIHRLWPHGHIEGDLGLNACIRQIRAALGDDAGDPLYVETLRARGYRLIASVEAVDSPPHPGPSEVDPGPAPARRSRKAIPLSFAVGASALVIAGLAGSALLMSDDGPDLAPLRLGVMPVSSIGVDTAGAHLRDGLTEDIVTSLANADPTRLMVVGRASVDELISRGLDTPEIAERLELDYLLSATLRPVGSAYRLTTQLVRADQDVYVWSESIDAASERVSGLYPVLAGGVLEALGFESDTRLASSTPRSEEVQDAVSRARYLRAQFSHDASGRALGILEGALGPDSSDVAALIEIARHRLIRGELDDADLVLHRAAELDSTAPGMDHVAGRVALYGRVDLDRAVETLARAVRLKPGTAEVRHDYAQALAAAGRLDEAVHEGRIAKQLDPVSTIVLSDMGWIFYYAGSPSEARSTCRETLELRPESLSARKCVVLSAAAEGALGEVAEDVGEVAFALGADSPTRLRLEQAARGEDPGAIWSWISDRAEQVQLDPIDRARALVLLGRREAASRILSETPSNSLGALLARQDPLFTGL